MAILHAALRYRTHRSETEVILAPLTLKTFRLNITVQKILKQRKVKQKVYTGAFLGTEPRFPPVPDCLAFVQNIG